MTVVDPAEQVWAVVSGVLRERLSEAEWNAIFAHVTPRYLDEGCITLEVPSSLLRDRIEQRYTNLMLNCLDAVGYARLEIDLRVGEPVVDLSDDVDEQLGRLAAAAIGSPVDDAPASTSVDGLGTAPSTGDPRTPEAPRVDQRDHSSHRSAKYTFETFVTGPSNRFAQAAALSVAETPARSYNPLFVYGSAGLGKTHLLRAIANYIATMYPTFVVRYISTETMLNEFIDAIRNNRQAEFKRRYREIDVLLVDDVQFMEGKEQLQEEFFHTFNTLHEANRQIVLSSDRPPDAVSTLQERLRSRFKWGLVTDIQPPDAETRIAILRKKLETSPVPVPAEVLEFIAEHVTNNIRELEGALLRVTAYAKINNSDVTLSTVRVNLADILAKERRDVTPEQILRATATRFNFSVDQLRGRGRSRPLVNARHIAMYLFRELTDLSYPDIANEFEKRDHTTIIHGVKKIETQMAERKAVLEDVNALIKDLKSPSPDHP